MMDCFANCIANRATSNISIQTTMNRLSRKLQNENTSRRLRRPSTKWVRVNVAGTCGGSTPVAAVLCAAPAYLDALYPERMHLSAKVRAFVDFLGERLASGN